MDDSSQEYAITSFTYYFIIFLRSLCYIGVLSTIFLCILSKSSLYSTNPLGLSTVHASSIFVSTCTIDSIYVGFLRERIINFISSMLYSIKQIFLSSCWSWDSSHWVESNASHSLWDDDRVSTMNTFLLSLRRSSLFTSNYNFSLPMEDAHSWMPLTRD